jgi:hypothetical protein
VPLPPEQSNLKGLEELRQLPQGPDARKPSSGAAFKASAPYDWLSAISISLSSSINHGGG